MPTKVLDILKLRVLVVIESSSLSGRSRNLLEFACRAPQEEPGIWPIKVTIATYSRGGHQNPLAVAATNAGLKVHTIKERRRWDLRAITQLRHIVDEVQPDILDSRNVKSSFLIRILGLHKKYPWVAWNHGYTDKNWLDRIYNRLDRWSLRGAHRVITVCDSFARDLSHRDIASQRIRCLHNFVRPFCAPSSEAIQSIRRELMIESEPVILAVGRLSCEKNHASLLRAAAVLAMDLPKFRIVIVGDGPERDSLLRLARRLRIQEKVTMAGFRGEVAPFYAMAKIFVQPSLSEGSPNSILEAMSAGLPIVATGVGGVPEILGDGVTGVIVPPADASALAVALKRLLSNGDLRLKLGRAAQKHVAANHTFAAYSKALVSYYAEARSSW